MIHYTIGQRIKLGGLKAPLYVAEMNTADNTITAAPNEGLFTKKLLAGHKNLIPFDSFQGHLKVQAKLRYAHKPANAQIVQVSPDKIAIVFDQPQRAITPGQAVVFYDGDYVIGGGTILSGVHISQSS